MIGLFLLLSLSIKIFLLSFLKFNYWYDEIIVTEISKQSLPQLLYTIQAEPHPPGFYLLLKLFPVNNPIITKSILTIICYSLILATLSYASFQGLISRYKLSLGLIIFFCSYTFQTITSDVKQNAISFPLTLLALISLTATLQHTKKQTVNTILINSTLSALLFFNYINYLICFTGLILIFIFKKTRLLLITTGIQSTIALGTFLLFIHKQIILNSGRFSWVNEFYTDPLNTLSVHLSGSYINNLMAQLVLIIFFALISIGLTQNKTVSKKTRATLSLLTLLLITVSVFTNISVRSRYITIPLLFLSIQAGWGLSSLPKSLRNLFPVLFFSLGLLSYTNERLLFQQNYNTIIQAIDSLPKNKQSSLLIDENIFPLAFKLHYLPSLNNIYPTNFFHPQALESSSTITQSLLTLQNHNLTNLDETAQLLNQSAYDNYIYLTFNKPQDNNIQSSVYIPLALNTVCNTFSLINPNPTLTIHLFENCAFTP